MKNLALALLLALVAFSAQAQQRNRQCTLFASQTSTATLISEDMSNESYRGVHVVIDVTAITTGTLTPKIQGKDPISGKYYDMLTSAALNATGTTVLKLYPGMAVSANVSGSESLPVVWRVVATKSDASSWTYSIGCSLEY